MAGPHTEAHPEATSIPHKRSDIPISFLSITLFHPLLFSSGSFFDSRQTGLAGGFRTGCEVPGGLVVVLVKFHS